VQALGNRFRHAQAVNDFRTHRPPLSL
jgi:hypothetical protein